MCLGSNSLRRSRRSWGGSGEQPLTLQEASICCWPRRGSEADAQAHAGSQGRSGRRFPSLPKRPSESARFGVVPGMGQCGCGDFYPQFKLPGPNGSIYAIELFSGCHDCRSPAGVSIVRLSGEQLQEWEAEHIPLLEWAERSRLRGDGYKDRFLTLVDVEKLAKYLDLGHDLTEVYRGLADARPEDP